MSSPRGLTHGLTHDLTHVLAFAAALPAKDPDAMLAQMADGIVLNTGSTPCWRPSTPLRSARSARSWEGPPTRRRVSGPRPARTASTVRMSGASTRPDRSPR